MGHSVRTARESIFDMGILDMDAVFVYWNDHPSPQSCSSGGDTLLVLPRVSSESNHNLWNGTTTDLEQGCTTKAGLSISVCVTDRERGGGGNAWTTTQMLSVHLCRSHWEQNHEKRGVKERRVWRELAEYMWVCEKEREKESDRDTDCRIVTA